MMRELATAIHELAMTGRLSDESVENLAVLMEDDDDDIDTDHVELRDTPTTENDNDKKPSPAKSTPSAKKGS